MGVRDRAKDAWKALFRQQAISNEPQKPQGGEVGFTGTRMFAGLPMEEYNPDLAFPLSTPVYDEMRKSDGQIAAVLQAIKLPIRSTKWYFDAETDTDNDELAQEIAEFMEDNFFGGMRYSWDDFLREALLMLEFGFSVFEKVWKFDTWQGKPVVMLDKYAPRVANSIWRFPQDENYNVVGVQQINYMTGQVATIPLDKCRVFTYQREGDNIAGTSILRPSYKHWYIKDALYKIVAVGVEKTLTGTPYAELPEGTSEDDKDEILDSLAASRVSPDAAITIPKGVVLGILEGKRSPMDAMPFIEHHDTLMARSVLAQFINLGTMSSASGGSYALGNTMVDMFCMGLETIANAIQHEVQRDVELLTKWNFGDDAPVPKLKHKDITFRDMSQVAQALYWLGAGHILQVDEDVEDYVRDIFGLPPIPEDALRNQQPGVETSPNYNPTVIPTTPGVTVPVPQPPAPGAQQNAAKQQQRVGDMQAAGQAAAAANRAAMSEVHIFTEAGECSCGHVHTFDDPTGGETGGETGEPAGTKKWRRDLTAYEKVVKLDDINDKWDQAETGLQQQMQETMQKATAGLQKQIQQIADNPNLTLNQKMTQINALEMQSGQYQQAMQSQIVELFKYGQQTAAEELGVPAAEIPAATAAIQTLKAKAEALAQLQLQKAAAAIKVVAIQNLSKNVSTKTLNYAMNKAADNYLQGPDLKGAATITVSDAINVGRGSTAKQAGVQGAQWSAILDGKTCPLCESLDGKVISADNPDFDIFQPPLHNNCRCILVFIHKNEKNVRFDWSTPSGDMVKKYANIVSQAHGIS